MLKNGFKYAGLWGQKVPKLLILDSGAVSWGGGSQNWSILLGCIFIYPPLNDFGSILRLWRVDGVKDGKLFKKIA